MMPPRAPSDHALMMFVCRSYLPSAAGQAAYYQAETCGGLAVCQPLTRITQHHHLQGESPAEEVRHRGIPAIDLALGLLEGLL